MVALIRPSQGRRPIISLTRDQLDVTSLHRPDLSWRFTDHSGHEHMWWDRDGPAEKYTPTQGYLVPTITWLQTSPATDDYPEVGYYICTECGDKVHPGYCSDSISQFIPGPTHFYVDGLEVKRE